MLDLSNNNGPVDFSRVHATRKNGGAGQIRVYLKLTEGTGFHDRTHDDLRRRALAVGMKVGEYHFARPSVNTPREEVAYFLHHLPKLPHGKTLRPCLDLEDPKVKPSPKIGRWGTEFLRLLRAELGKQGILYGSSYYIAACAFEKPVAGLWDASYGRNDGKEYPFSIPRPWHSIVAHQYTSRATLVGIRNPHSADLSHVFNARGIDL